MSKQYRFLARIIIEAKTPLSIGSGNNGIKSDSLILRDANGLPFIPGTTIAGLLRHSITIEKKIDEKKSEYKQKLDALRAPLMGSQAYGSPIIITDAKMLDSDGSVLDGIIDQGKLGSGFLSYFRQLPVRQHAKINHRGTTEQHNLFNEEVVLKGTRFCFEMEMLSSDDEIKKADETRFIELLKTLNSDAFRIGSGSRSGFGEIEVVNDKCQYKKIDLTDAKQKEWYLEKSSSLIKQWEDADELSLPKSNKAGWTIYELNLRPIDFMLFGSGLSNDKADMTYIRESFVDWSVNPAQVKNQNCVVLIPASSVKGALSHRLAFHYNKLTEKYADTLKEDEKIEDFVGKNNAAVKAVFGSEGDKCENGIMKNKQRGNVLISDIFFFDDKTPIISKVLNHVSIDRFTGGAIDGALFNEETLFAKGLQFNLKLMVNNKAFVDEKVKPAFESALKDLCSGMLPLGGGVNRGNGCFEGIIKCNGDQIYGTNNDK